MRLTTSATAQRKKGPLMTAQDTAWIAFLPPGWFSTQQAAFLWTCTKPHAYRRLSLLRCAGRVRQMERRGLWCCVEMVNG